MSNQYEFQVKGSEIRPDVTYLTAIERDDEGGADELGRTPYLLTLDEFRELWRAVNRRAVALGIDEAAPVEGGRFIVVPADGMTLDDEYAVYGSQDEDAQPVAICPDALTGQRVADALNRYEVDGNSEAGQAVSVMTNTTDATRDQRIVALAMEQRHRDGEVEIPEWGQSTVTTMIDTDGNKHTASLVSDSDDNGAYVLAWVWVSFDGTDLNKCAECGLPEQADLFTHTNLSHPFTCYDAGEGES